jgi:hypothetical protein
MLKFLIALKHFLISESDRWWTVGWGAMCCRFTPIRIFFNAPAVLAAV